MSPYCSEVEAAYLREFFDWVDFAASRELAMEKVAYEEFLSPLFAPLLDAPLTRTWIDAARATESRSLVGRYMPLLSLSWTAWAPAGNRTPLSRPR